MTIDQFLKKTERIVGRAKTMWPNLGPFVKLWTSGHWTCTNH